MRAPGWRFRSRQGRAGGRYARRLRIFRHPTAAAAPLAKTVAGFWTAKTVAAGAAGMAVVLCAGWGVHEVILRPETRVVQAQEPNRASVADKRTITSGEISFKSPQLPERAATVVLPGKNEEKNAAVQASSQDVGRGMTSGQRFEALRTGAGSTGGMIDTISNAWQDVKGTLTGESRRRSQCQNNLKQFGVVFKMFENDHPEHLWPALSPKAGHLMFANDNPGMQPVCPTYLADPGMLICPSDTAGQPFLKKPGLEVLDHSSYFYLGYVVRDIEELQAFSDAYVARVAAGLPFDTDLDTPSGKLYRLREGVERLLTSDPNNPAAGAAIQSAIPVFIEINHPNPDGGNVLFMDGHVEFIRYRSNSPFPINEAAMNILKSLSAMKGTASPR